MFPPIQSYGYHIPLHSTANACYKDAADLHADLGEYPQAIARYEQVADGSLSSALTKYSVKEYWLRACLCALAMGVSEMNRDLSRPDLTLALGPYHGEAQPDQVLLPRHNFLIHTRSKVYQHSRRRHRGRRPGDVYCRGVRVRPGHEAGQLEDEHPAQDKERSGRRTDSSVDT